MKNRGDQLVDMFASFAVFLVWALFAYIFISAAIQWMFG